MKITSNLLCSERDIVSKGSSVEEVQNALTLPNPEYANMHRYGKGRFYKKVDPHICYLKKVGDTYIIPRYFFGEAVSSQEGLPLSDNSFNGVLRKYQDSFVTDNHEAIFDNTGVLLEAGCGSGKTVLGLYISLVKNRRTLVIVPTYYLAKQWKTRIKQFTNCTAHIVQSSDKEIPLDSDFTIVVMDLFICRVLPKDFISTIGHIILDEAHRVGAETYLPILDGMDARYRTALTATFRRTDGVHRILQYHFGHHVFMKSNFPRPHVYSLTTGVIVEGVMTKNRPHTKFLEYMDLKGFKYNETKGAVSFRPDKNILALAESEVSSGKLTKTAFQEIRRCLKAAQEMQYSALDTYLSECVSRKKLLVRTVRDCLESGRTVLFLSKRKDMLRYMEKQFSDYRPVLIIRETAERSDEQEEYLQKECRLVLGVTQLAKEGLDIDRLDTLIIHLPMKDTEQATGRIARLFEGKKNPLVLYPLDKCPMAYAVWVNAQKFFSINAEVKGNRTVKTLGTVL